jgi:glycosyltransferase involved in cell wall biosynthesis
VLKTNWKPDSNRQYILKPRYLQIFESIGMDGAISEVTADTLRAMLNADWHVTVVASELNKEFHSHVEWRHLHVPKKLFAYKWLTARHYLLQARGTETFDVTHAHQPQISDSVDIFQCHYLTRAAANRNCLPSWKGREGISRFQEEIVLRAEDRFMQRLQGIRGANAPHILFDSELTKDEFITLYGEPQKPDVLIYATPPYSSLTNAERLIHRKKLVPDAGEKIVVGFLGGGIKRKGYEKVIPAIKENKNTFLLFGGPFSDSVDTSSCNRIKNVGFVKDKESFFSACDVFVVASTFEPLGMVALEAAAYGVPVIATPSVGALKTMQDYGAALPWYDHTLFGDICAAAVLNKEEMRAGAQRLCQEMDRKAYDRRIVELCESIRETKLNTLA